MSQPDTTIEGIIKQFLVEVMEVVGDEFAPKQEGGSLERQRLLGLLVHTVPLQIETAQALESYINNKVKEARIDELEHIEVYSIDKILEQVAWYGSYKRSGDEPEGPTLSPAEAKQAITSLIKELVAEARIEELSHVWYDDKLGLVLAHGTGINHRIQQLKSTTKELEK